MKRQLFAVGRLTIVAAMIFGVLLTWNDLLGIGGEGGFTFIQKYTGFISPGIFAMFILGMFWKRTTGAAAWQGIITGFLVSVVFNNYATSWFGHETLLYTAFEIIKDVKGVGNSYLGNSFPDYDGMVIFYHHGGYDCYQPGRT
jgi:SSS family solute:Na+ symporter